jgi:hypothetical protein
MIPLRDPIYLTAGMYETCVDDDDDHDEPEEFFRKFWRTSCLVLYSGLFDLPSRLHEIHTDIVRHKKPN